MSYYTVKNNSQAEISEKRSRFIGRVYKISSEEEAKEFIDKVKREHRDARHNVFAYTVGGVSRYSDDGEPSGTAGVPILEILKKREINDCLITVTRYFGGILLGTGGLLRAYSDAALKALEQAEITELFPAYICKIKCEYSDHGKVDDILQKTGGVKLSEDFTDFVEITFKIKKENLEVSKAKITEFSKGKLKIEKIIEKMQDFG